MPMTKTTLKQRSSQPTSVQLNLGVESEGPVYQKGWIIDKEYHVIIGWTIFISFWTSMESWQVSCNEYLNGSLRNFAINSSVNNHSCRPRKQINNFWKERFLDFVLCHVPFHVVCQFLSVFLFCKKNQRRAKVVSSILLCTLHVIKPGAELSFFHWKIVKNKKKYLTNLTVGRLRWSIHICFHMHLRMPLDHHMRPH